MTIAMFAGFRVEAHPTRSTKHAKEMFIYPKRYEVIVVGAGHAGVEAALASPWYILAELVFRNH